MNILWDFEDWAWSLSLIGLTIAIHATSIVAIGLVGLKIRIKLESRTPSLGNEVSLLIALITVIGLLLAALHGIEAAIWAIAYVWVGAVDAPVEAMLYSVDSMTTRGASGLVLPRRWQIMGALEAADGMLLFGISTAFVFAVMQARWMAVTQALQNSSTRHHPSEKSKRDGSL